jgi:squalene-associated FAD-dependent desaturase
MTLPGGRADVVVIGGGLAGISAAVELAEAGLEVTLVEARPWLGGATCSFARRGLTIDNGQHVFLRCCVAYRDLLAKLGGTSSCSVQDRLDLTVLSPEGQATLRRSRLPAPMHLAHALARYRLLSRAERFKAAIAGATLQFTEFTERDEGRLGDWLAKRGQDERARRMLWDLLSLSGLNLPAEDADLALAASAIRTAVLAGRDNADLGLPDVALSKLHGDPAAALLGRLGASVRLGVRAEAVQVSPAGGYDVRLIYGAQSGAAAEDGLLFEYGPDLIHAAGVVLAVPAWETMVLAPPSLAGDAAQWSRLGASPVISIHVIYGSRVTRLPFAAAVGSPVHWVVDKTGPAGLHTGQYLAASVRAADSYVDMPVAELRADFLPALARLFPAAADASVEDFFVTRERRATIRHEPGSQRLRGTQSAGLPGLAVAGAWTDTGWPDTMEGAVRSGRSAALKILGERPAARTAGAERGLVPAQADRRKMRVAP